MDSKLKETLESVKKLSNSFVDFYNSVVEDSQIKEIKSQDWSNINYLKEKKNKLLDSLLLYKDYTNENKKKPEDTKHLRHWTNALLYFEYDNVYSFTKEDTELCHFRIVFEDFHVVLSKDFINIISKKIVFGLEDNEIYFKVKGDEVKRINRYVIEGKEIIEKSETGKDDLFMLSDLDYKSYIERKKRIINNNNIELLHSKHKSIIYGKKIDLLYLVGKGSLFAVSMSESEMSKGELLVYYSNKYFKNDNLTNGLTKTVDKFKNSIKRKNKNKDYNFNEDSLKLFTSILGENYQKHNEMIHFNNVSKEYKENLLELLELRYSV